MAKKYDVVAKVGFYKTKDGVEKAIYKNVGSVIETKNGLAIKADGFFDICALPKNDDGTVWLNLYEPKENRAPDAAQQAYDKGVSQQAPVGFDEFDDGLPF